MNYTIFEKTYYDKKIKIGKKQISCYSLKKLKSTYPDGGYEIIGEARVNKKGVDEDADTLNIGDKLHARFV